jgi:toxin YoeB
MEIEFTRSAKKDLEYWKKAGNSNVLKRVRELLDSIIEDPFNGIGKPEPLKHQLEGKWSRRIDKENRLVYSTENKII